MGQQVNVNSKLHLLLNGEAQSFVEVSCLCIANKNKLFALDPKPVDLTMTRLKLV